MLKIESGSRQREERPVSDALILALDQGTSGPVKALSLDETIE